MVTLLESLSDDVIAELYMTKYSAIPSIRLNFTSHTVASCAVASSVTFSEILQNFSNSVGGDYYSPVIPNQLRKPLHTVYTPVMVSNLRA